MNPGRFYTPNYIGVRNIPIYNSMFGVTNSRGIGLFSKITNGIRAVNWNGLLSNANKTLNVVNQAIPLVRQAGPMVNNMKSMLRIAKAFGNETNHHHKNNIISSSNTCYNNKNNNNEIESNNEKEVLNYDAPNFFV